MAKLRTPLFNIPVYANAWWIGRRYEAITWFGSIHFNCSREELKKRLGSEGLQRTERHEHIHILQAESFRTRYVGFYVRYVMYWLRGLVMYRSATKAYYNIPFEREAYANDMKPEYGETHWKDYRGGNKQ